MPCGRFASPPPQRRMRRGCCFGASRAGRGRPTGELWEAAYGIALQRALADTIAHVGEAGVQAALQGEANRCLAYGITHAHDPYVSPEWHQRMLALHASTLLRLSWGTGSVAGMHSRAPGPAAAPDGSYGDSGREVKLFADGGDRCALRLPTRALVGLLGGAVAESWRLHATGPLREALRRRLVVRPRHLDAPYLRYTDTELASLVAEYANAGVRLRIHALGNLAGAQAPRVLSSDHPCGSVDPLHNLRAAVERRLPGGQQLQPEQALTRTEAVRAATVNAATSLQAPAGGRDRRRARPAGRGRPRPAARAASGGAARPHNPAGPAGHGHRAAPGRRGRAAHRPAG